jgi:hypothetical protein
VVDGRVDLIFAGEHGEGGLPVDQACGVQALGEAVVAAEYQAVTGVNQRIQQLRG